MQSNKQSLEFNKIKASSASFKKISEIIKDLFSNAEFNAFIECKDSKNFREYITIFYFYQGFIDSFCKQLKKDNDENLHLCQSFIKNFLEAISFVSKEINNEELHIKNKINKVLLVPFRKIKKEIKTILDIYMLNNH